MHINLLDICFIKIQKSIFMLIATNTGATQYENIRNQKTYSSLLLEVNYAASDTVTNYKVSGQVQKKNGTNITLFNKVKLSDLALISAQGEYNTFKDVANTRYFFKIELAEDGNLAIEDGEEIVLAVEGCNATHTLKWYGIEEPGYSHLYKYYETKVLLSEFTNVKLTSLDSQQVCVIDNITQLSDVTITFDNGEQIKYLPEELKFLAREVDFFGLVSTSATASIITNEYDSRIVLPIDSVTAMEFNKNAGQVMNVTFMSEKQM